MPGYPCSDEEREEFERYVLGDEKYEKLKGKVEQLWSEQKTNVLIVGCLALATHAHIEMYEDYTATAATAKQRCYTKLKAWEVKNKAASDGNR